MTIDQYSDLKAIPGEARYAEYDDEFETWGVFGEDSGFCYGQYACEEEAEAAV